MAISETADYNYLALQLYELVKKFCYFPHAIIKTQCKRINKTPGTVTVEDLPVLAPWIGKSVATFTNPIKGEEVEKEIRAMIRQ
jgi:hypothetical protein